MRQGSSSGTIILLYLTVFPTITVRIFLKMKAYNLAAATPFFTHGLLTISTRLFDQENITIEQTFFDHRMI